MSVETHSHKTDRPKILRMCNFFLPLWNYKTFLAFKKSGIYYTAIYNIHHYKIPEIHGQS